MSNTNAENPNINADNQIENDLSQTINEENSIVSSYENNDLNEIEKLEQQQQQQHLQPEQTHNEELEAAALPTKKEKELLDLVFNMENDKQKFLDKVRIKIQDLQNELEQNNQEKKIFQKRIFELETTLKQKKSNGSSSTSAKGKKSKNDEHDEILMKAKTLLFEKSKVCKQQEQQLDALHKQIIAIKEVAGITKEMLNLRNIENSHMQARLDTMALRVKSEKDRLALTEKKLEISSKMYTDLKAEYDIQTGIFQELRSTYEEKIDLLTKQLAEARAEE